MLSNNKNSSGEKEKKKNSAKRPVSQDGMRLRLADLCSRSEQCESDLRMKITRAGLSKEEGDQIIDFLKTNRFLDNARFARAYARDKLRFAGWGRNKIRAGLYAKGIAADDIKAGLDAIEEGDYIEAMLKTGRAKASRLDLHTRTDAAKFIRYMQSRGFESGLIFQLLDALRMDAGD